MDGEPLQPCGRKAPSIRSWWSIPRSGSSGPVYVVLILIGLHKESARGTESNHSTAFVRTTRPYSVYPSDGRTDGLHPGYFEGDLSVYGSNKAKLGTTLVKQLALYVTMYSPTSDGCRFVSEL